MNKHEYALWLKGLAIRFANLDPSRSQAYLAQARSELTQRLVNEEDVQQEATLTDNFVDNTCVQTFLAAAGDKHTPFTETNSLSMPFPTPQVL